MTIQSQLDQVLALAEKATPGKWETRIDPAFDPHEYTHVAVDGDPEGLYVYMHSLANTMAVASAVNFLREHGPAIRAAVGGEAVNVDAEARRLFELNSAGWAVKAGWDELHPQTRELWHAHALKNLNPPATVDVGELADRVSDLLHRIEGFGKAYPTDMFSEVTDEEREWLHATRPGLMDRIAASMGRHVSEKIAEDLAGIRNELVALIGEKA